VLGWRMMYVELYGDEHGSCQYEQPVA